VPPVPTVVEKPEREKKPKIKADPKLVAAARELRDRWLEHVNSGQTLIESAGKYDVTRALPARSAVEGFARPHPSPLPEGEGVKAPLPLPALSVVEVVKAPLPLPALSVVEVVPAA
jgi:hypothetical protein